MTVHCSLRNRPITKDERREKNKGHKRSEKLVSKCYISWVNFCWGLDFKTIEKVGTFCTALDPPCLVLIPKMST